MPLPGFYSLDRAATMSSEAPLVTYSPAEEALAETVHLETLVYGLWGQRKDERTARQLTVLCNTFAASTVLHYSQRPGLLSASNLSSTLLLLRRRLSKHPECELHPLEAANEDAAAVVEELARLRAPTLEALAGLEVPVDEEPLACDDHAEEHWLWHALSQLLVEGLPVTGQLEGGPGAAEPVLLLLIDAAVAGLLRLAESQCFGDAPLALEWLGPHLEHCLSTWRLVCLRHICRGADGHSQKSLCTAHKLVQHLYCFFGPDHSLLEGLPWILGKGWLSDPAMSLRRFCEAADYKSVQRTTEWLQEALGLVKKLAAAQPADTRALLQSSSWQAAMEAPGQEIILALEVLAEAAASSSRAAEGPVCGPAKCMRNLAGTLALYILDVFQTDPLAGLCKFPVEAEPLLAVLEKVPTSSKAAAAEEPTSHSWQYWLWILLGACFFATHAADLTGPAAWPEALLHRLGQALGSSMDCDCFTLKAVPLPLGSQAAPAEGKASEWHAWHCPGLCLLLGACWEAGGPMAPASCLRLAGQLALTLQKIASCPDKLLSSFLPSPELMLAIVKRAAKGKDTEKLLDVLEAYLLAKRRSRTYNKAEAAQLLEPLRVTWAAVIEAGQQQVDALAAVHKAKGRGVVVKLRPELTLTRMMKLLNTHSSSIAPRRPQRAAASATAPPAAPEDPEERQRASEAAAAQLLAEEQQEREVRTQRKESKAAKRQRKAAREALAAGGAVPEGLGGALQALLRCALTQVPLSCPVLGPDGLSYERGPALAAAVAAPAGALSVLLSSSGSGSSPAPGQGLRRQENEFRPNFTLQHEFRPNFTLQQALAVLL